MDDETVDEQPTTDQETATDHARPADDGTKIVPLEDATEAGEIAGDLAELSSGRVKIRDLVVEDDADDDPVLRFRDGRVVDTWRED